MEHIIKSIKKSKISVSPVLVISNNANAEGLEIAKKLGVKTEIIESKGIKGASWDFDKKIISALEKHNVKPKNGLICLAGFMRIMSPEFIRHLKGRIMNMHPAILPSFPGLHSQKQALDYGVKFSGCRVHFVDEGIYTGPIILQDVVNVKDDDTEETLSKRILVKEHRIYAKAVKLFAEGKIRMIGHKTIIS